MTKVNGLRGVGRKGRHRDFKLKGASKDLPLLAGWRGGGGSMAGRPNVPKGSFNSQNQPSTVFTQTGVILEKQ